MSEHGVGFMSAGHSTGTSAAVTGGVDTGAEPPTPAPAPTALSAQQQHQHQPQHRPTPVNNTGAGPGSSTSISTSTVAPDLLLAAKIQAPPSPTVAAQDCSNSINNNNTDFSSSTATIRHITDDQPASDPAVSSSLTTTRQTRFSDRRSSVLSPTAVSAPDDRPHDTSASPESHLRDLGREQIVIPSIETQISPGQPPRTANTDNESLANSGPVPFEERLQRSSTFPLATPVKSPGDQYSSPTESETSPSYTRRAPASRSSQGHGYRKSDGPPISLRTRIHATDRPASYVTSPEASPHETAQGQRELLLPKALSSDERRAQRPPLSYKPPGNVPSDQLPSPNPVRVPPIRGFRSSGSRRSLTLDMNNNSRAYEGDEPADPNYDRTLRALEGRHIAGVLQMTPPASARRDGSDADDGGDVFLRIAREEGSRRNTNENVPDETQSMVSRAYRSHRRPLSTNVASYQPTSPPPVSRRLSDQQERSRSRHEDDRASEIVRSSTVRASTWDRDRAMSAHPAEDLYRTKTSSSGLRPSPMTARVNSRPDGGQETYTHTRRRSSITDQNSTPPVRTSTYRASGTSQAYGKAYNSSPLVRSFDTTGHRHSDAAHGPEGTESTGSTTAPSTVWDELDDLKSRLHRLELTGKLPSTSAAAVSRLSDERPPTATTTVTTMSSSPKRSAGGGQAVEAASTTSSQREAYPTLLNALSKIKPFLNVEVYRALESTTNDAIALSSMMGTVGQPGPISSSASTVGPNAPVTDRQLRRKAESVCRSLTELCVALGEDAAHTRPAQTQISHTQTPSAGQHQSPAIAATAQNEGPSTPTVNKSFSTLAQKRPSVVTEQPLPKPVTSPSRAMSKFEERRNTILNGTSLPSPRAPASGPTTPQDPNVNRRSSLMFPRTRRAVTEEPEETSGRRSSLLLRTRRGGTEEPEEGRQTSMMYRGRRGTIGDGDEDSRHNITPKAYTEVNATRGSAREYTEVAASSRAPTREYAPQPQATVEETITSPTSALPRRRFVSSSAGVSRLATPATATASSGLPTRKYLERSVEREAPDTAPSRQSEERPQRYYSLGQTLSLNRSGSLNSRRQNRDSTLTSISTTATAGGYR